MKRIVARWEVKGGKRFVTLYEQDGMYSYEGDGCGGVLLGTRNDREAIAYMQRPWGSHGAGPVTVLRSDFPSVKRVR